MCVPSADALIAVGDLSNAAQHFSRARDAGKSPQCSLFVCGSADISAACWLCACAVPSTAVISLGVGHSYVAALGVTIGDLLRTLGSSYTHKAKAEYERASTLYESLSHAGRTSSAVLQCECVGVGVSLSAFVCLCASE